MGLPGAGLESRSIGLGGQRTICSLGHATSSTINLSMQLKIKLQNHRLYFLVKLFSDAKVEMAQYKVQRLALKMHSRWSKPLSSTFLHWVSLYTGWAHHTYSDNVMYYIKFTHRYYNWLQRQTKIDLGIKLNRAGTRFQVTRYIQLVRRNWTGSRFVRFYFSLFPMKPPGSSIGQCQPVKWEAVGSNPGQTNI